MKNTIPRRRTYDRKKIIKNETSQFYHPPKSITKKANVKEYEELYKYSIENPEKFWAEQASTLKWFKNGKKFWMPVIRPFISGLPEAR